MQTSTDLRNLLARIDRKGYPAYKDTRGAYQFPAYVLSIDHVQGDPFAAPSKLSIHVNGKQAGFPRQLYQTPCRRIALQDALTRQFGRRAAQASFQAKGSGHSGLISISRCGQEVLERTACALDPEHGDLLLRLEVGFPANGRTINARELEKILFDLLPRCVEESLLYRNLDGKRLQEAADLAEDQQDIRRQLPALGLCAFVADGSILPRTSGVSSLPMKQAVPFRSPRELSVTLELPHRGTITGMGIPKGITLIVGGGYHGKSTLLKALELGVYDHIAGDGREYVITDRTAVKIRAEDGRSIRNTDISMFINNLPNGKDTVHFTTEDASGSTSQAAGVVEAMEAGTSLLLMDEDTSATNFMIRDELMQRVIHRDMEPITSMVSTASPLSSWQAAPAPSSTPPTASSRWTGMSPGTSPPPPRRRPGPSPPGAPSWSLLPPPVSAAVPDPPPSSGETGSSSKPWAGTAYPSIGRPSICGMWSSWLTASSLLPWAGAWSTPSGA